MLSLALANIRMYSRRFIAVTLAVMIGTAFLAATLMVNASTTASLERSIGEAYQNADLVAGISPDETDEAVGLGSEQLTAVRKAPGVAAAEAQSSAGARIETGSGDYNAIVQSFVSDEQLRTTELDSGAVPADREEITVDRQHAESYHLKVGDEVGMSGSSPDGSTVDFMARISGITISSNSPFMGSNLQVAVSPQRYSTLMGSDPQYESLLVRLDAGTDPAEATSAVAAALKSAGVSQASVLTAQERTVDDLAGFTGGQDQLTGVLLVFALIALVVTGLVVMNTFAVLVAQRTRELALLRTLGALSSQLRRSVLVEAFVVGLVSSVLGVLLAIGVMAGLVGYVSTLPSASFAVLAVPPSAVIAGLLAGTVMTLIAAWAPARKAMSVAPLAALRPADSASVHNRVGKVRLIFGSLLLIGGGGLLIGGAVLGQLLLGFAGGLFSFIGVLMLASLFLPGAVRAVGRLFGGSGVPAQLASLNSVRNPGRTTATATALLIGVTLVSMMMVGAQTTKQSFNDELARNYLVDVTVDSPANYGEGFDGGALPGPDVAAGAGQLGTQQAKLAAGVDGIEDVALLKPVGRNAAGEPVYAAAAEELARVLKDPSLVPGTGEVLVGQSVTSDDVEVTAYKGSTASSLAAKHSRSEISAPLMTLETARQLDGYTTGASAARAAAQAGPDQLGAYPLLWLKTASGLSTDQLEGLSRTLATELHVQDYQVAGGAVERSLFNQVIDTLLLVVSGLLAVAVFIALIGVANTLSLSVLERTRESALLRALGLTRGQLKSMLALEAILIAGVAAALGIALGTTYGVLGVQSAIGSFTDVTLSLPWAQLALVLGVSVLAALAASVLPARRAARLSPVEGLATE
ncbi:ABC transporter permease [Arthrobacter rhombi]|uniref:ABC transporter permease n=1 Tax=Arthrobacter rhombi TaxID=71253 RepID=UPI003FD2EFC3